MITIRRRLGMLGVAGTEVFQVPADGSSYRELVQAHALSEWAGLPVAIARNGELLEGDELDELAAAGDDLVVGVNPALLELGTLLLYVLAAAAVSVVINLAMKALLPQPKQPGETQDIGDESSPSLAWDGVRTTQGQGLPIATVCGRRGVGGHIIFSEVVADSINVPGREIVRIVLVLSRGGRIDKIGGISAGVHGAIDGLGGFAGGTSGGTVPAGIKINGNLLDHTNPTPGVRVWLRYGELDQPPLPAPFTGAKITDTVGEEFHNADDARVYTIDDTSPISSVAFVVTAPAGIYQQDPSTGQRSLAQVVFEPRWRRQGTTAWQQFVDPFRGPIQSIAFAQSAFSGQAYAETWQLALPAEETGPLEVRLKRITPTYGSNAVDAVVWRQITWASSHTYSYPSCALIAFEIETGELFSGGTPSFIVPVDGLRLVTYDPTNGLATTRTWEVPTTGPHNYWLHPPGRNPAWVLLEVATAEWGLGRHGFTTARVDLPALANLACYCDAQPGPVGGLWDEARYCCDLVADSPRSAWEWLQAIAGAAGAVVFLAGDKLTVAYRYRDAHSIGPISVPAKVRSQLFSAPALADATGRWIDPKERPAVLDYQIRDEDADWAPTPFAVRDPATSSDELDATDRDPGTAETVELITVTRRSQAFRMGYLAHGVNRLSTFELVGTVGYFALAAAVGDIIAVQSVVLRPFPSVPVGVSVLEAVSSGTSIRIDVALTLAPSTSYVVQVRTPTGGIDEAAITSPAGDYSPGDTLTLATPISCNAGAPAAVGVEDEVTIDVELLSVGLDPDGTREFQARLWTPDAYDEPTPADFDEFVGAPAAEADSLLGGDFGQQVLVAVPVMDPADLRVDPEADARGSWRVSWPTLAGVAAVEVFVRRAGSLSWWSLGRSSSGASVLRGYSVGDTVDLMVSTFHASGVSSGAGGGGIAQLVLPEFPADAPPQVHDATQHQDAGGVLIRWRTVDDEGSRVVLRIGAQPETADEVFEGRADQFVHQGRGAVICGAQYFVAVRDRAGMLGPWSLVQDPQALSFSMLPAGCILSANSTTLGSATLVDLTADSEVWGISGKRIADGKYSGTATSAELKLIDGSAVEYEAEAYWGAAASFYGTDYSTLDDWDAFEVGSGEALWRSIDWREASLGAPGVGADEIDVALADSLDGLEASDVTVGALSHGEPGRHAWGEVWARYYVGGVWTAYERFQEGRRKASRMQLQVRMFRDDLVRRFYLVGLLAQVWV